MDNLIDEIKAFVGRHPPPKLAADAMLSAEDFRRLGYTPRILFPVVSPVAVAKAQADIGFPLPPLLKGIYTEVSNGLAGFPYDILGIDGGCASDSGTLVEAYVSFKTGGEYDTGPWKVGLLPFCDWGCAIYSCVDCTDSAYRIFTYEGSGVRPERYSLSEFFEQWLQGKVNRSHENADVVTREIINPSTGKPTRVAGRRKRKPNS